MIKIKALSHCPCVHLTKLLLSYPGVPRFGALGAKRVGQLIHVLVASQIDDCK